MFFSITEIYTNTIEKLLWGEKMWRKIFKMLKKSEDNIGSNGKVSLIGSTFRSKELSKSMRLIRKSKMAADEYEWLYQCTSFDSLVSIIENRELWLSNLTKVNDQEEVERITVPEYEKLYYVACFTYRDNIPKEHWDEYGKGSYSVLFGFKKEWVRREMSFLNSKGEKIEYLGMQICDNYEEATDIAIKHRYNPYFINNFDFYKIIYSDKLKRKMNGNVSWNMGEINLDGNFIVAGLPGIIKSKKGKCVRPDKEPYVKRWTTEKEVRLKVGVDSMDSLLKKTVYAPKMAVKLNDEAFNEVRIRFSPLMDEAYKEKCLGEIQKLLPHSRIVELK